jgi:hypothetical protein
MVSQDCSASNSIATKKTDMVSYSPKALFRQNEGDCIKWNAMANDPVMHKAIAHAQASMAHMGLFGPEHMKGVATFVGVLLNMAEETPLPPKLPVKQLIGDNPQAPLPTTTTPAK